jgi:hypothetical protein
LSTALTFSGMEQGPWTAVNAPSIAPCPPDAWQAVAQPDGTRFYAIKNLPYPAGVAPYAGILWKQTRSFLPTTTPFTTTRKWTVCLDDSYPLLGNVAEFDGMYAISNGDVANESFQINLSTKTVQIVNASGAWVDVAPITIPVGPTPCGVSSIIDPIKETISVQMISVGDAVISVPAALQNIPFFKLGWMPPVGQWTMTWQNQIGLTPKGGAVSYKATAMSANIAA